MQETVFMQEGDVLVTSTRIEIAGQTFATRNVGSVKVVATGMSGWAIALALVGLVLLLAREGVGAVLLLVGAGWAFVGSQTRELHLMAGGGEVMALRLQNAAAVEKIRAAVAQAIAVR